MPNGLCGGVVAGARGVLWSILEIDDGRRKSPEASQPKGVASCGRRGGGRCLRRGIHPSARRLVVPSVLECAEIARRPDDRRDMRSGSVSCGPVGCSTDARQRVLAMVHKQAIAENHAALMFAFLSRCLAFSVGVVSLSVVARMTSVRVLAPLLLCLARIACAAGRRHL